MTIHRDIKEAVRLINASGLSAKEKEEAIADLVTAHAAEKAKVEKQPAASVQEAKRILATQLEQLKKDHICIKPEEPYSVTDYQLPKNAFFFGSDGKSARRFLANKDGLEIAICFDYELARECKEVVALVKNWPEAERRVKRLLKLPYLARWTGGQGAQFAEGPVVPTICLAARKWFPGPWFNIPPDERSLLVKLFGPAYDSFRPLIISEGHEPIDQTKMRDKAMSADNARGHYFKRYTMLVDWSEPATRIQKRFENWLAKNKPLNVKTRSRRGHHKPAELLWALIFYRLSKYPVAERDEKGCELLECSKRRTQASKAPKHCGTISSSRIARGKKRIQEQMKHLRYV
jgi:hypothetical protein